MEKFGSFFRKEFLHVLRDWKTMLILFGMPLAQILIFGFALTNEVKNSHIGILDLSKDRRSNEIIMKLDASKYFDLMLNMNNYGQIEAAFRKGEIRMAVIFPAKFDEALSHGKRADIRLVGDASDPNTSNTLINYASAIIYDYHSGMRESAPVPMKIAVSQRFLFNPQLKGSYNFVPGVMAMVLMLVCAMMTSISIVKEKEMGTMEIILVSPVKPLVMILSKMAPYFILSAINIFSILVLSVFVLEVPINGSLVLLVSECLLFTVTVLSLGLLISSIAQTQQVAMLVSLMGMFLPTVMLSGFMFPIENMPVALQVISNIVPAKWFYYIVKSVMIKGVGFAYVWKQTMVLIAMTAFFLMLSIKKFKTRLE